MQFFRIPEIFYRGRSEECQSGKPTRDEASKAMAPFSCDLCLRHSLRAVIAGCFRVPTPMMDLASFRAQGKLVTLLAVLLQRAGITPIGEFSELLGIFAVMVAENEPEEGEILAGWAAMVRDFSHSDAANIR